MGLESALARTEADSRATQKAADAVVRLAKQLVAASRTGDVGALERSLGEAGRAIDALRQQFVNTREGWNFNLPAYIESGELLEELTMEAATRGMSLFVQDERIFSYPLLLRLVRGSTAADCAVMIDGKKSRALRPGFLADRLKAERQRTPKFTPGTFLRALHRAYEVEVARRYQGERPLHPTVELLALYELLTLFPGLGADYTRQEFARDIYLLDRSGATTLANGTRMELAASRGQASRLLRTVGEDGQERVYYAISFVRPGPP